MRLSTIFVSIIISHLMTRRVRQASSGKKGNPTAHLVRHSELGIATFLVYRTSSSLQIVVLVMMTHSVCAWWPKID